MSIATKQPPAATASPARKPDFTPNQLLAGAFLIAGLVSAVSLIFNHAIDYDPDGWIVYAREVFRHLSLNTSGFPAWKPLPVILIGPITWIFKGEGDVYYWLFITRACGILTVFAAASLANRYGGKVAAVLAAVFVLAAPYWLEDSTIGRDSAISGALMLGAFLANGRGWYRIAVLELMCIALLRPEATPLLFVYGVYLWRTGRTPWWFPTLVIAFIALMWLVPTIFHTGLSPAQISRDSGGPGAAVNTSFPFYTVIKEAAQQAHQIPAILAALATIVAVYGLVRRWRGREGDRISALWGRSFDELMLIGAGLAWVLIVATETEKGFAGNPRYLVPGVVLLIVAGAVLAVRIAGPSPRRQVAVAALCAIVAGVLAIHPIKSGAQLIRQRDAQIYAIRQELLQVDCHGRYYITDHKNNAYLAQITGEPLQDSISWSLPYVYFKGPTYWFVYCAPPGSRR